MRYFFVTLFLCSFVGLQATTVIDTLSSNDDAKQRTFTITPSVTLTNKHLWRSFSSGNAPCIEPNVNWRYKNLSLDTWAAYAIDNSYKEIDFILSYSFNVFSVTLSDYYCPKAGEEEKFTTLKNEDTDHLFEIKTDFTISRKLPVNVSAAVFFAGSDVEKTEVEVKQLYSTYLELSYPFRVANTNLQVEVGMTPAKGMYANEAKVFNYGFSASNRIKINDKFSLPMKYKLAFNANDNMLHFGVMLTLI